VKENIDFQLPKKLLGGFCTSKLTLIAKIPV